MKNKTKIMLGLAALTAGTLAAGATGTFAWFTTNKTATATYTNIVARGTTGNLQLSMASLSETSKTDPATGTVTAASIEGEKSYVSDVSSNNGYTFGQPVWKGTSGNGDDVEFWSIADVSKEPGYFTQFSVTLSNIKSANVSSADTTDVSVYLQTLTIAGETIAPWTRVAIITDATVGEDGYISSGTATLYQQDKTTGAKYVAPTTDSGNMKTALTDCTVNNSGTVNKELFTLKAGEQKTIYVSVWLEGTLADSQDSAKGKAVSVSLVFGDGAAATN